MTSEEKEALADTCRKAVMILTQCKLNNYPLDDACTALLAAYISAYQESIDPDAENIQQQYRVRTIESATARMHELYAAWDRFSGSKAS